MTCAAHCRFHHIKSPQKRKSMADWSHDLKVGGFYKVGYPGVAILEGLAPDIDEYIARLKSQQWKAMAVRGELETSFDSSQACEERRKFTTKLVELGDKDLGLLGEQCRAVGLEALFLTALKIDKG
jgi:Protein of unknown function (DUF1115)